MLKQTDKRKQRQAGFTLTEVLLTVALLICLLAVSFVALPKYIRHIQITDLDNAAKEIYMAAQNQAILLKSSGELEKCVIKTDGSNLLEEVAVIPNSEVTTQITAYHISKDDAAMAKLLPKTSIEQDLWDGSFYIVYEPVSGSVIDVFYAKSKDAAAFNAMVADKGFKAFYDRWRAAPQEDRMNADPMIGYYGGESAGNGNTISLRTPVVNIYNEDELRAEVTYWIPRNLYMLNTTTNGGVKLNVELSYDGRQMTLPLNPKPVQEDSIEYISYKYTWKLDTLEEGKKFKDLFTEADDLTMGKDFTITAEVTYEEKTQEGTEEETGLQVNGARKSATDNSLFAKGSVETTDETTDETKITAKIAYMRHLQNLSSDISDVKYVTTAEQIDNITCNSSYSFIPIENDKLTSYNGRKFEIRDLHIDAAVTNEQHPRSAYGLFGKMSGTNGMSLSNIKLVNARVNGGENPTGGLVGNGANMTIDGCGVYWENTSATEANLRSVLGDSDKGIEYKIQGKTAGGLAGEMNNSTITGSFAATTVKGNGDEGIAGGLVGKASSNTLGKMFIERSYGDNYLKGHKAAGLIGKMTGELIVNDSYATGFIANAEGDKAAGFCLGDNGVVKSERAYSTMMFSEMAKNYPFNEKETGNEYDHSYFLGSEYISSNNISEEADGHGEVFATLSNPNKIASLYGSTNEFEMKNSLTTFPYNLQTDLNLTAYSYPGIKGIDHYGDWGAEFRNGSLVYYERYDKEGEEAYAFNGGNLSMITDDYAVEDGYALAFLNTGDSQFDPTVEVKYQTKDEDKTATLKYSLTPGADEYEMRKIDYYNKKTKKTEKYYLLPLPGELDGAVNIVNSTYAPQDFYEKIEFSQGKGDSEISGVYYFNPHFANAVTEYREGMDLKEAAEKVRVQIRTARHLHMLSEHSEYYASSHKYDFVQTMNIDYSIYSGYDLFPKNAESTTRVGFQDPIGISRAKPFNGKYHGECHTIENVGIRGGNGDYIGLFGYSTGLIEDTAYYVNEETVGKISSNRIGGTVYMGGLAGYNGGTIKNCAVAGMEIDARAYNFSTVYAGGLAGWNRGTIQDSSAALTQLSLETNNANGHTGGFVGLNTKGGTVKRCYAVGRVNTNKSKLGSVYACGFAGSNRGYIGKCYAAVDLKASGEVTIYGFCEDEKNSGTYDNNNGVKNNYYMNEGNFQYEDIGYTAQYEDKHADWKKYGDFVKKDENMSNSLSDSLSMSEPGEAKQYNKENRDSSQWKDYPYPSVVKDSEGKYIHYGEWPELLDLNQGGIYYWEKLVENDDGKDADGDKKDDEPGPKVSYHISAIILDPDKKTVGKVGTLSTEHSDGCAVTEYGYGYFTPDDEEYNEKNNLSSSFVSYYNGEAIAEPNDWSKNTVVDQELSKLMLGVGDKSAYVFHSYNTWGTNEKGKGLFLDSKGNGQDPWGTWELTLKDKDDNDNDISYTARFNINPFFADSMSLSSKPGDDWNVDKTVPSDAPGSEDSVPFYVRSIDQLQFINWNCKDKGTGTVLVDGNKAQFPFLGSSKESNGDYYWKQSHDLYGNGQDYTPIAELYDTTTENWGTLYGWFGGTYDGDDYVIQDVNIEGQTSSVAGLFGMVYDGTLKNIIMYSPTGKGTITAGNSRDDEGGSAWYAIGGLAGFAATSKENASAIENCAIAGYTIKDSHIGGGGWGGTCMGGLIGVSCMDLKGCTAVTNINSSVQDNDNVRIGGLVGTSQRSISRCYAGGNIDVTGATAAAGKTGFDSRGIYIGGIVGGVYFKPLNGPDGQIGDPDKNHWIENALKNCYSYVTLPSAKTEVGGTKYINALYAVGGPGEITHGGGLDDRGNTTYENCYYLNDVVWSNNGGTAPITEVRCDEKLQFETGTSKYGSYSGKEPAWPNKGTEKNSNVTAMSYSEMANGDLKDKLNDNIPVESEQFGEVTKETPDHNTINGKYSFTSDQTLAGQNYPFPTILTQNSRDGWVNVHYGAWPIEGIYRENGSIPIEIDLFADYDTNLKDAVKEEMIGISSTVETGGTLTYKFIDENGTEIAEADALATVELDKDGFKKNRTTTLTLTGQKAGLTRLEITYTVGDKVYSTIIDVNVTATLQLLPEKSPIMMFTEETAYAALKVVDRDGDTLTDLLEDVQIDATAAVVEKDSMYLESANLIKSETGDGFLLKMVGLKEEGITKVTLNYGYTYREENYEGNDPISVEITSPTISLAPLDIYLEGAKEKTVKYGQSANADEKINLTVNNYNVENIKIIEADASDKPNLVWVRWYDKEDGILEITGCEPQLGLEKDLAAIRLQLRYNIDGVIHESRHYLQVNVNKGYAPGP